MDIFGLIVFFGVISSAFIAERVFTLCLERFFQKQAEKTKTELDDNIIIAIKSPIQKVIYCGGIYFAVVSLGLDKVLQSQANNIFRIVFVSIVAWLCFRLIDVFSNYMHRDVISGKKKDSPAIIHFLPLIKRTFKLIVGLVALVIVMQQMGYSATSLLTGLGITGLAFGFAAKETIANVFGSFSVILDITYKVGDWIVADKVVDGADVQGIVEDISLRSTKIRAFDNTLIIIPNNIMGNATIKNVSKHKKRRIYEFIDITYDTPADKVEKAVDICRHIVANHPEMEDYFQIHLNKLGAHSLQIMFYVFTKTTDWGEYLRIRQELFLAIMREFEQLGVEFAFPTQTLYMKSDFDGLDISANAHVE